jgi:hypothetical protein
MQVGRKIRIATRPGALYPMTALIVCFSFGLAVSEWTIAPALVIRA